MQKADGNHENSDHESDLEFDPWEEEEFLEDPLEENLEETQMQEQSLPPQDTPLDLPPPNTENQKPAKKRSSSGLLLLILVIAGGGAGGYYYLSQNSGNIDKPIVRLDTDINSAEQSPANDASSQNALQNDFGIPTPLEDAAMQGGGAIPESTDTSQKPSITEAPVLTPFPDNIEESTVELAPLDEPVTNAENTIPADDVTNIEGSPAANTAVTADSPISAEDEKLPVALEENELLSKTEQAPSLAATSSDTPPMPTAQDTMKGNVISEATSLVQEGAGESPVTDNTTSISTEKIENQPAMTEKNTISPSTKPKPVAAVKEQVKQPKVQEKAPEWEIRGANPQSAVLYEKNSGETRTVEPGDTVKGLGKITKIAKESGLWVVTGTQNKVNQQ